MLTFSRGGLLEIGAGGVHLFRVEPLGVGGDEILNLFGGRAVES